MSTTPSTRWSSAQRQQRRSTTDSTDPNQTKKDRKVWSRAGRGGGRGGKSLSQFRADEKQTKTKNDPPLVHIYTTDFAAYLKRCNGAARFKVHKPLCDCPKVKHIRNEERTSIAPVDDQGSFVREHDDSTVHFLDGLVVMPEIGRISAVYLCQGANTASFEQDPLAAEATLNNQITYPTATEASWKLSCASCMLVQEPNGFVCISSSSSEIMDQVRDLARSKAKEKGSVALHEDHAHHVCTFPLPSLLTLRSARTREQKRKASDELLEHMMRQDIPMEGAFPFKLQHHLTSVLDIFAKKSLNETPRNETTTEYVFVIMYDDTNKTRSEPCWSLDLPGGKRHLGETTFEAAMRETEEESSLEISPEWMKGDSIHISRRDPYNAYFLLRPPPNMFS